MATIRQFRGEYFFLSNFFPHAIALDGIVYATAEHAFAAAKTGDIAGKLEVAAASTADEAKRIGRRVILRPDWETVKIDVMRGIIDAKFDDPTLAERLLRTGNAELSEGNDWGDRFWGVCRGKGANWLGRILMDKRTSLALRSSRE